MVRRIFLANRHLWFLSNPFGLVFPGGGFRAIFRSDFGAIDRDQCSVVAEKKQKSIDWALISAEIQQNVFSRETAHFCKEVNFELKSESYH